MKGLLILVDKSDNIVGAMDKLSVHEKGLLHRAFSIFIFNSRGELLLQQRADNKYHSGGLWSNTCCSHPEYGEGNADAVKRRLEEEMGMNCSTRFAFSFIYKVQFDNGLTEYEFDHVYLGSSDVVPTPNPQEVKAWQYMSLPTLKDEIAKNPQLYTEWLKICLPMLTDHLERAAASLREPS